MVRLDECVEALYDKTSMENRQKTLAIMKVMKGAISVSKSRTGECIFRHNKFEKKKLETTIKKFKSDTNYTLSRFDTRKKFVVSRWRTMLEKQTTCISTRLFSEILDIDEEERDRKQTTRDGSDDDSYFKKFLQLRLQRREFGANGFGLMHYGRVVREDEDEVNASADHEQTQDEVYVTERKDIRRKYSHASQHDEQEHMPRRRSLVTSQSLRLPSLPKVSIVRSNTVMPKTEDSRKDSEMPEFERDLTDWSEWRLKDKDWLLDYIKRQKTRHEDLIMRNALSKIESEMSGNNTIRRHQIRARLQRAESMDQSLKTKSMGSIPTGEGAEASKTVKTAAVKAPEKGQETLSVRDTEETFHEKPRRIHKEMTKVKMRSLSEPLPVILENPTKKKNTAELPLITISKA